MYQKLKGGIYVGEYYIKPKYLEVLWLHFGISLCLISFLGHWKHLS